VPTARHYADHRPYPEPPARLSDLAGPIAGEIELPRSIDWGPAHTYDMGSEADRRIVYERVLREAASTEEVCRYVNGPALVEVWGRLWLPMRVRSSWESRLSDLARAAQPWTTARTGSSESVLSRWRTTASRSPAGMPFQANGLVDGSRCPTGAVTARPRSIWPQTSGRARWSAYRSPVLSERGAVTAKVTFQPATTSTSPLSWRAAEGADES